MNDPELKKCLSCGETRNMGSRRYCSLECRQRLRHQLDIRTGLLRALNTRYAIFYFTESEIILDVVLKEADNIFSFVYSRKTGNTPAEDFIRLSNRLGNAWWSEKRKTDKRYLANRHVLDAALKNKTVCSWTLPRESLIPALVGDSLVCLKLSREDLNSPRALQSIKSAFRNMAKLYHPDCGGDAGRFRKIHQAYQQLLSWSESPKFIKRRGFTDKWFYDGEGNRWVQPTPCK
jgi:hypothetical protein